MGAGGDLGHDAAERGMERRLVEDDEDRISPAVPRPRTTAAAVSSQLLSRPRTVSGRSIGTGGCARGPRQVTPRDEPDNSCRRPVTATLPTLLLTRPEAQSRGLARRLAARIPAGVPILVSPILEIVPGEIDLPAAPGFLILTSVHGAAAAGGLGALKGLTAWCVGDRTAEAARAAGLAARSAGGTAEDLLACLVQARPAGLGLYLHGRHVATDLAAALARAGIETYSAVAYDQVARPLSAEARACLARPGTVILPIYSPRSARILAAETERAVALREVVAISRPVADAWSGGPVTVAAAPDGPAMEDATVARVRAHAAC
jgi:uroporphyrinogen-III synthase